MVGVMLAGTLALGGTALAVGLQHAGPGHDGTAVTSIGYTVTPAGKQTNLGDLPLGAVSSPDGRWLVVSNDGQGTQSLQVIDTTTSKVTQTLPYPAPKALFVGLAFARDGKTLYASGGGNNLIRRYTVTGGTLTEGTPIPLATTDPAGAKVNPLPAGIAVTPDGQRLLVADQQADALSTVDLATGAVHTAAAGHRPYAVVASADGHSAYVTDQGANTVAVLDLTGPESAPNARALENGYATLDNFYADAEISAQGWNWTVAANSNPYSEQVWPGNYSGRGAPYPSESGDPAIAPNRDPAQAYIWDRLAAAKISFRNYGFYVDIQPDGSSKATDPLLDANTDHGGLCKRQLRILRDPACRNG
jgi:WD40 repeat protein